MPIQKLSPNFEAPLGVEANNYQYNGIELVEDFGLHINHAAFRTLDPQTGRWWQVDPLAEKYAAWSGYNYVGNNPMLFIDPRGASRTWYYSESGQMIGAPSNDNLPDAIVAIPDAQVSNFQALRESGVFGDIHSDVANQNLRTQGITYLTGGLLAFAEQHGNGGNKDVTFRERKIISMTHNGKPVTGGFFAEWGIRLKLTAKGEVTTEGDAYTSNAFNYVSPEISSIGNVHLHPMPGDYEILVSTKDDLQPIRRYSIENHSGPSYPDKSAQSNQYNHYHNIAIDPINMYLYREPKTIYDKYGRSIRVPASNITIPLNQIK